jgi:hypothetical protein
MAGYEKLDERDKVEDHAQARGVQSDAIKKIAGAGKRKKCICQADEVTSQREA